MTQTNGRRIFGLLLLGAALVTARGAVAGTPFDVTNWNGNDGCAISVIQFVGDNAYVVYSDGQDSDANWTFSGNELTLSHFSNFPADTFTGKFDGVTLTATHTWEQDSAAHSEECTFTKVS